jgi:hypothetical protein
MHLICIKSKVLMLLECLKQKIREDAEVCRLHERLLEKRHLLNWGGNRGWL